MDSYLGPGARLIDHRRNRAHDRSDILRAAGARATALRSAGVAPGCRVALAHGDGPAFVADLLAIWSLGAAALVVSHGTTEAERANIAAVAKPRAWIGENGPDGVPSLPPAVLAPETAPTLPGSTALLDDVALILMTSGTTGRPKGVMLTHRALQARLALNIAHIGCDDLAVSLNVLPMHFGHGLIGNTLTPLAAGAALVAWPEPGPAGLAMLGEAIDAHRVTFMSSVPSLWRAALKLSPPPGKASLRRVHVGSAPLSAALWREIAAWAGTRRIVNMYGITEAANWIGGASAEDASDEAPLAEGCVGRPWGGSFRILTPDGTLLTAGRGEILVSTPALMSGYLDRPDLTEEALAGGWLRTGDVGELRADGSLRLVGRTRHEINRGGIKVPAEEIDTLLERHPAVAEACAFPLPDPLSGEAVAAAVVLRDGAAAEPDEIIAWCERMIRREAVPDRIFLLRELAKSERGKLDREAVRAACAGQR